MSAQRVLFIGGSGVISSACSRLAVERGIELTVLNRGASTVRPLPPEATVLRADIRDPAAAKDALGDHEFDAVVDWVAFTPEHVHADIDLFRGRAGRTPVDQPRLHLGRSPLLRHAHIRLHDRRMDR